MHWIFRSVSHLSFESTVYGSDFRSSSFDGSVESPFGETYNASCSGPYEGGSLSELPRIAAYA